MNVKDFDYAVNLLQSILWQYNDAERLQFLIGKKQEWFDANVASIFQYMFDQLFNLETADENGLYIWSIILDLPLYVQLEPSPVGYPAFGFANFGFNFFGDGAGSNFAVGSGGGISGLTLEQQRQLLQMRFFQLTTNGSVTEINRALDYVFGNGAAYVVDNFDMTMTYVFVGQPSAALINALVMLDVLPRPAAVELNISINLTYSFGFADFGRNFLSPSNFLRA